MSEVYRVKGAEPGVRGPAVGPGGGGGRGRGFSGVAHADGREDKRGLEDLSRTPGNESRHAGLLWGRGESRSAGVAGSGLPVTMATAGLVASRTRAGGFGGRGHRGSGAYVSPVGFFPFDCT